MCLSINPTNIPFFVLAAYTVLPHHIQLMLQTAVRTGKDAAAAAVVANKNAHIMFIVLSLSVCHAFPLQLLKGSDVACFAQQS